MTDDTEPMPNDRLAPDAPAWSEPMPSWAVKMIVWVAVIGAGCVIASILLWLVIDPAGQVEVDRLNKEVTQQDRQIADAAKERSQLRDDAEAAAQEAAAVRAAFDALAAQLRAMGIEPVVTLPPAPTRRTTGSSGSSSSGDDAAPAPAGAASPSSPNTNRGGNVPPGQNKEK